MSFITDDSRSTCPKISTATTTIARSHSTFFFLRTEGSTSPNLWSTLNEDWKGGCPIRLSLGPQGFWWGEKEWIENPTTKNHLVQAFGVQPQTLVNESKQKYPGIRSFEIDFVTIGVKGAWVMGTNTGDPCWGGITEQLERTLKREMAAGHRVKVPALPRQSCFKLDKLIVPGLALERRPLSSTARHLLDRVQRRDGRLLLTSRLGHSQDRHIRQE